MSVTETTARDREAAKRVLARCASEFGYNGNRPYAEMVKYVAEAIGEARRDPAEEALAQIKRMQDFLCERGLLQAYQDWCVHQETVETTDA